MADASHVRRLSNQQFEKFTAWLKERVGTDAPHCPLCKHQDWGTGTAIARLFVDTESPQDLLATGDGYPQVVMTCQHCGNTLLFNAITVGFQQPSDDEDG